MVGYTEVYFANNFQETKNSVQKVHFSTCFSFLISSSSENISLSLLALHLWQALIEDTKAGTDEPPSSLLIFNISAAVIPQWGPMTHICVSYFVQYGYYRFFSFAVQPTHYVPVVTMGMSKQGDGCISTEVLHYMSAFEISKLDRIVYQRGVDFTVCKLQLIFQKK